MPILFKCEHCRARLSISRKKAGKLGTCPKCGEPIHIPEVDEKPALDSASSRSEGAPRNEEVPREDPSHRKEHANRNEKGVANRSEGSGAANKREHRFKQLPAGRQESKPTKVREKGVQQNKAEPKSHDPVAKGHDSKFENKPFAISDSEGATSKASESGSSEVFPAVEVLPRAGASAQTVVENKRDIDLPSEADRPSAEKALPDSDERIFDITEDYLEETKRPLGELSPNDPSASNVSDLDDEGEGDVLKSILLPRWIVYFQAGLIGVVAATFFVFGMMVGNLTGGNEIVQTETESFKLTGNVKLASGVPDSGAVVIVLPTTAKPEPRPEADPLHPDNFEPIDNPSLDQIREFGGDVVRANRTGEFEFELEGPAEYYVLVVSKAQTRRGDRLDKEVSAKLGRYFLPYEPLIDGKKIQWTKVRMTSDRSLKTITF